MEEKLFLEPNWFKGFELKSTDEVDYYLEKYDLTKETLEELIKKYEPERLI